MDISRSWRFLGTSGPQATISASPGKLPWILARYPPGSGPKSQHFVPNSAVKVQIMHCNCTRSSSCLQYSETIFCRILWGKPQQPPPPSKVQEIRQQGTGQPLFGPSSFLFKENFIFETCGWGAILFSYWSIIFVPAAVLVT